MLHMNTKPTYQHLYDFVLEVAKSVTERDLEYNMGTYTGWTSARLMVDYSGLELSRLDKLVHRLYKAKNEEFKRSWK